MSSWITNRVSRRTFLKSALAGTIIYLPLIHGPSAVPPGSRRPPRTPTPTLIPTPTAQVAQSAGRYDTAAYDAAQYGA